MPVQTITSEKQLGEVLAAAVRSPSVACTQSTTYVVNRVTSSSPLILRQPGQVLSLVIGAVLM